MKLDENGGVIWEKVYGGSSEDFGKSVQSIDGGSLVAGDILDVYPEELMAEELLGAHEELGYDAIGLETVLSHRDRFPLINHNLTVCLDENRCIFFTAEPGVIEKPFGRVGIVSLVDPGIFRFHPDEMKDLLHVDDPEASAEVLLSVLDDAGVDLVVLLFHGSYERARELFADMPGIDAAIVGHEQRMIPAELVGDTIMASPGEAGNRLGILEIEVIDARVVTFTNRFHLFRYETDPDDPMIRSRIESYNEAMRSQLKNWKPK